MTEFRIYVTLLNDLPAAHIALTPSAFPNLAAEVKYITRQAHEDWLNYARGEPLPDGRSLSSRSGTYVRSIQYRYTGDFEGEVYSELPYARTIEDGWPARDLHDMLGSSLKVRLTKSGKRYLIIPFRLDKPGTVVGRPMPSAIYNWWRGVSRSQSSHITSTGWRDSGTSAIAFRNQTSAHHREKRGQVVQVRSREYSWGRKLGHQDILGMGLGEQVARRYAGMYRFDSPDKPGKNSQFINFRALVEGSSGWRTPAKPGMHIAQTVEQRLRPIAQEAFGRAMQADLLALLRSQR